MSFEGCGESSRKSKSFDCFKSSRQDDYLKKKNQESSNKYEKPEKFYGIPKKAEETTKSSEKLWKVEKAQEN